MDITAPNVHHSKDCPASTGKDESRRFFPDKMYASTSELRNIEYRSSELSTRARCPADDAKFHYDVMIVGIAYSSTESEGAPEEQKSFIAGHYGSKSSHSFAIADDGTGTATERGDCLNLQASAAINVLKEYLEKKDSDTCYKQTSQIIIKVDAPDFVEIMTERIEKWEANDYAGQEIHKDYFGGLQKLVIYLAGKGVIVKFWSVPRFWNIRAKKLARKTMEGWRPAGRMIKLSSILSGILHETTLSNESISATISKSNFASSLPRTLPRVHLDSNEIEIWL